MTTTRGGGGRPEHSSHLSPGLLTAAGRRDRNDALAEPWRAISRSATKM